MAVVKFLLDMAREYHNQEEDEEEQESVLEMNQFDFTMLQVLKQVDKGAETKRNVDKNFIRIFGGDPKIRGDDPTLNEVPDLPPMSEIMAEFEATLPEKADILKNQDIERADERGYLLVLQRKRQDDMISKKISKIIRIAYDKGLINSETKFKMHSYFIMEDDAGGARKIGGW